jgi:hypothetical protein
MVTLTRKQRAALIRVALDKPEYLFPDWGATNGIASEDLHVLNRADLIAVKWEMAQHRHWDITDKGLEVLESYDNSQTSAAVGKDADAS